MNNPRTLLGSIALIALIVIVISALWRDNILTTALLGVLLALRISCIS